MLRKTVGLIGVLSMLLVAVQSAAREVSFQEDVMPILQAECVDCHSPGTEGAEKSGLLMNTYENLMKGTKYGPVIESGNSLNSVFNQVVEGRVDESIAMPYHSEPLSEKSIEIIKAWVDQGAKNN
jgi:hypothetical protein